MALRRTRIKGIANIPQRKKPGETLISNEAEDAAEPKPTLLETVVKVDQPNHVENLKIDAPPQADICSLDKDKVATSISKEEAVVSSPAEILPDVCAKKDSNNIPKTEEKSCDKIGETSKKPIENKPAAGVRRRFLKPQIALGAISRKKFDKENEAKQTNEVDSKEKKAGGSQKETQITEEKIQLPNSPHFASTDLLPKSEEVKHLVKSKIRNESVGIVENKVQNASSKVIILDNVTVRNSLIPQNNKESIETELKPVVIESNRSTLNETRIGSKEELFFKSQQETVKKSSIIAPDVEYPPPPASPSKINRARIKAIPRFSNRKISFSASESEDESKRNHSRIRNDSVCSTVSTVDHGDLAVRPREFNTVIQRKCRRTDQSRKLAEARREFYMKFGNDKPDRKKLTMIDLIFYNPTTNLMSDKRKNSESSHASETPNLDKERSNEEKEDDPEEISDEDEDVLAPQIKVGPQGEIIIDEKSLVIESKATKKNRKELEKSSVVDGNLDRQYGVYKRVTRSKDWSKTETLRFYKALNTIGMDFGLMCELFPKRTRRELKLKFKKEERINKTLVDKAVMQPCAFDFQALKDDVELEEAEFAELEKQKEEEKKMKRKDRKFCRRRKIIELTSDAKKAKLEEKPKTLKRKNKLDITSVLDDDPEDYVSDASSEAEDEDSDNEVLVFNSKPTRSGRIPKERKLFDQFTTTTKAPNKKKKSPQDVKTAEPGSIMVLHTQGPAGEPVYQIFMVTDKNASSGNGTPSAIPQNAENIMTLSMSHDESEGDEENVTIFEENNVTIDESGRKDKIQGKTLKKSNVSSNVDENNIRKDAGPTVKIFEESNVTVDESQGKATLKQKTSENANIVSNTDESSIMKDESSVEEVTIMLTEKS